MIFKQNLNNIFFILLLTVHMNILQNTYIIISQIKIMNNILR